MGNGGGNHGLEGGEIADDHQMVDGSKVVDDGDHPMRDSGASGSGGNTTAPVASFPPPAPAQASAFAFASAPSQPNNAPSGSPGWQPPSSTSSTVSAPNGNTSSFAGSSGSANTTLEAGEIVEDDKMVGGSDVVDDGDHTMQDSEPSCRGGSTTTPTATFPPPAPSANLFASASTPSNGAPAGSLGWQSSSSTLTTVSAPNGKNSSFAGSFGGFSGNKGAVPFGSPFGDTSGIVTSAPNQPNAPSGSPGWQPPSSTSTTVSAPNGKNPSFAGSFGGFSTNMGAVPFGSSRIAASAPNQPTTPTGGMDWQSTSSTSTTVSAPNGKNSSFAGSFGGFSANTSAFRSGSRDEGKVIWFQKAGEPEDQDMDDAQTTAEGGASSSVTVGQSPPTNAPPPSLTSGWLQQGAQPMFAWPAAQQLPTPPQTPSSVSLPATQAASTTPTPTASNVSPQAPSQPQIASPAIAPPTGWTAGPRPGVKSLWPTPGGTSGTGWSASPFRQTPAVPAAPATPGSVASTPKPSPFSARVGPATQPVQVPRQPLVAPTGPWKPPPPAQFNSAFTRMDEPVTPSPAPRPAAPLGQGSQVPAVSATQSSRTALLCTPSGVVASTPPTPKLDASSSTTPTAASDVAPSTPRVAALLDTVAPKRLDQASASHSQSPNLSTASAQQQEPEPWKPRLNPKLRSLGRQWLANNLGQSTPPASSPSPSSEAARSVSPLGSKPLSPVSPLGSKPSSPAPSSSRRSPPGKSPLSRQSFSAASLAEEVAKEEAAAAAPIVAERKRRDRDDEQVGVPDAAPRPIKARMVVSGKGLPVPMAAGVSSVGNEGPAASNEAPVPQAPGERPT